MDPGRKKMTTTTAVERKRGGEEGLNIPGAVVLLPVVDPIADDLDC